MSGDNWISFLFGAYFAGMFFFGHIVFNEFRDSESEDAMTYALGGAVIWPIVLVLFCVFALWLGWVGPFIKHILAFRRTT